jgi:hypothetical protein
MNWNVYVGRVGPKIGYNAVYYAEQIFTIPMKSGIVFLGGQICHVNGRCISWRIPGENSSV